MSTQEIQNMIAALGTIRLVFRDADPRDKAEVYRRLNLRLTYQPATQTARAEANLDPGGRGVMVVSEGGLEPYAHETVWTDSIILDRCEHR
jgi:hypothetical protein